MKKSIIQYLWLSGGVVFPTGTDVQYEDLINAQYEELTNVTHE